MLYHITNSLFRRLATDSPLNEYQLAAIQVLREYGWTLRRYQKYSRKVQLKQEYDEHGRQFQFVTIPYEIGNPDSNGVSLYDKVNAAVGLVAK